MRKIAFLMAIMLANGFFAVPSHAENAPQDDSTRMSKAEIIAFISNKTVKSTSGKGAGYYAPNGDYFGRSISGGAYTGDVFKGKWRVNENNTLCVQIPKYWGANEKCNWKIFRNGDISSSFDLDKRVRNYNKPSDYSVGNTLE